MGLMDRWAPAWTAESWDRVGLVTGHPGQPAARIRTALELTPELLDTAIASRIDLLLLHHPPLFKPLTTLRNDRPATARLLAAAQAGLALFAAHTNLDAAPGGVNDALAGALGLVDTSPLEPVGGNGLRKLVVFAPPEHAERIASAMFAAGAGRIGEYRRCSFACEGIGSFLAPPDSDPFLGSPGDEARVDELRLETVVPAARAADVVRALLDAHPYEEPAWDLYPLEQAPSGCGLGRVGRLAEPLSGRRFVAQAAAALEAPLAAWAGPLPDRLERVAVLGGSGGDYLARARAAGAQVLVTGEARYHDAEAARDLGVGLVTLGHFPTENLVVRPWARKLADLAAAADLECEIAPWTEGSDPWSPAPTEREE